MKLLRKKIEIWEWTEVIEFPDGHKEEFHYELPKESTHLVSVLLETGNDQYSSDVVPIEPKGLRRAFKMMSDSVIECRRQYESGNNA